MGSFQTNILVTGVARSGTTALAELLNSHADICLGIERFKFQFLIQNNFSATLFEKDRFFDFRAEDTNLDPALRPHWQPVYDGIREKWDTAKIIGDKVPDLTPILKDFAAENPDFKYIFILRNLKDVGLSWQSRANRTRDKWPSGKGFVEACKEWSEQMIQLKALSQDASFRKKVLLIDYDRMFQPETQTLQAILNFLELETCPPFEEVYESHVAFAAQKQKRKVPAKYAAAYKSVDMSTARDLRQQSRRQVEALVNGTA